MRTGQTAVKARESYKRQSSFSKQSSKRVKLVKMNLFCISLVSSFTWTIYVLILILLCQIKGMKLGYILNFLCDGINTLSISESSHQKEQWERMLSLKHLSQLYSKTSNKKKKSATITIYLTFWCWIFKYNILGTVFLRNNFLLFVMSMRQNFANPVAFVLLALLWDIPGIKISSLFFE